MSTQQLQEHDNERGSFPPKSDVSILPAVTSSVVVEADSIDKSSVVDTSASSSRQQHIIINNNIQPISEMVSLFFIQ